MAEFANKDSNWKQVGDVLKTEGNILEIGSFIAQSGNKVDVSPEDAALLFNNIDTSLPFVISHEDGYQEEIGYATQFAENDQGIGHKGFVFNNENFKQAIAMGYNSISPVIDFEKDATGKVINGKIVKLAFVPNPAMKQNKVNITRFAFSAPEVNSMTTGSTTEQPAQDTVIQGQTVPGSTFVQQQTTPAASPAFDPQEFAKNIAASIVDGFSQKIGSQLESMQQKIDAMEAGKTTVTTLEPAISPETKDNPATITDVTEPGIPQAMVEQFAQMQNEIKEYKVRVDKEEKAAYSAKLAELRALGQDSPEKLVAHLKDTNAKIETLDQFKAAIIKNTPMNSPQTQPLGAEGGKNQQTKQQPTVLGLADSLKLRIDAETANKLSQSMRIPVQ